MKRRPIADFCDDKFKLKARSPFQLVTHQDHPLYHRSKKGKRKMGITASASSSSVRRRTSTHLEQKKSKERRSSSSSQSENPLLLDGQIDDIFLADLMNQVGFPEDSLVTIKGLLMNKLQKMKKGESNCYPQEEELLLLLKNYQTVIKKHISSWRALDKLAPPQPEPLLNANRLAKVMEYRKKIETEVSTLCHAAISFTEELQTMPFLALPAHLSCHLLTLKLQAYSIYSLSKLLPNEAQMKHEHIQRSLEIYNSALNLAQANLTAHHWLRLQLSLDTATIYMKNLKQSKCALDIANKAFDGAVHMMTDINSKSNNDKYEDILIILQNLRDLIAQLNPH